MIKLLNYFFKNNKCSHEKVAIADNGVYCPDCGEFIIRKMYIARCSKCNAKRESIINLNEIQPLESFCSKCGCSQYYLEEKEHFDFFDLNYAVLRKEIYKGKKSQIQVWVEEVCQKPTAFLPILNK